jgi:F420-dependent oxidoreductase-like protein
MQYGFMTEPQAGGSYDELLEVARWAESLGFDVFARSDHYLNMEESVEATDALVSLAGLARDTGRIQLATMVSPLTFRHPAVMAKSAATIDQMSGGRMALGVGTGWMQTEHDRFGIELPPMRERFSRLYETLAYLHACFGRADGGFTGRHYRVADMPVLPEPTGTLPLIVGGGGPKKTPTMAGRFADEYNMFSTTLDMLAARVAVMREAAEDAGRDADAILISMIGYPVVGEDEAEYRERLAERAAVRDMPVDEYEALLESRNLPHGTADRVRAHMAEIEAAGVGRFYLQVYAALPDIDTADVERVYRILSA